MAQFDIHARPGRHPDDPVEYLLDLQTELLDTLQTRLAAPLVRRETVNAPLAPLNPVIAVNGKPYLLLTQLCAAVPQRALGAKVGTAQAQRSEIVKALDFLVSGI